MDKVFEASTEECRIPSSLRGQTLTTSILTNDPYTLVGGTVFMRGIIGIASSLVVAIDLTHLVVATIYLAQQLSVVVIEVEVHPATAITGHKDVTISNLDGVHGLFPDIPVYFLLNDLMADRRQGIAHEEAQTVLMTIQGVCHHTGRVAGSLQTGYIAISIQLQLQLSRLT